MSAAYVQSDARSWSCFVVICLAWTFDGHAAQPQTEEITFDLRITEQPLDEALQEFSRQTSVQVIFFSNLTAGIQSPGVRGKYTVASALNELLTGSGLSFRMINARTVQIRKEDATQAQHGDEGE